MNSQPPGPDAIASVSPRRRSRFAIVVPACVVVLTLGVLAWSAWPVIRPARSVVVTQAIFDRAAAHPVAGASTDTRKQHRAGPTVQAAGWLEAEPFYTACTALADGVVESIEVLEGDRVEQGQVVARLVSEDSELRLRQADAELRVARADAGLAQADVAAAQSSWDEPVELERAVESGRASVAESRAELAQLPSLVESAHATERRLQEELSRAEESRASGAATELEVIVARQNLAAQAAEVAALRAREPLLQARVDRLQAELRAAERDLSLRIEDRRRLDAARADLARARAEVEHASAARDEAALELERMVIHAPITGYVQQRLKAPGDKVMLGMDDQHSAHIVHLYDPSRLQVRVDVPLADAADVFVGQRCEVVVEVLPDRTFEGAVLRTTHEADLQKNTLQVKVKVTDPDPILRPEMLTRVKFLPAGSGAGVSQRERSPHNASVLVPDGALDHRGGTPHLWVVTERRRNRGVIRSIPVEPLETNDGWVTVRGPVQPGAILALPDGPFREGERVTISNEGEGA